MKKTIASYFLLVTLLVMLILPDNSFGQSDSTTTIIDQPDTSGKVVQLDTFSLAKDTTGIFKKFTKLLKFRENRSRQEEQRIYDYLEKQGYDSLIIGDTVEYITRALRPGQEFMAWYGSDWNPILLEGKEDYFSSINLLALSLKDIDRMAALVDLIQSQIGANFLKMQGYRGNFYFTIYCSDTAEISDFLNNRQAQDSFYAELLEIISALGVQGIIIDLKLVRPKDSDRFTNFIRNLKEQLDSQFAQKLILSVPTIVNETSLREVSALDFQELNHLLDYYLIRSLQFTGSPAATEVKNDDLEIFWSSVDYYANGKIPLSKLMVSYSWLEEDPELDLGKRYSWSDAMGLGGVVIRMPEKGGIDEARWSELDEMLIGTDSLIIETEKINPDFSYSYKTFAKELNLFLLAGFVLLMSVGFVVLIRSEQ